MDYADYWPRGNGRLVRAILIAVDPQQPFLETAGFPRAMSPESQVQMWADSPAGFFALTFVLAAPFYILNALAYLEILGGPGMGPIYIALFTVTPIASASLLTLRQRGRQGLKRLLWRTFDFKRIEHYRWYVAVVVVPLLISLLSLGGAVLSGAQLPPTMAPLVALPVLLPFFFVLAAGEEVGWMGHAFEPMQTRKGALRAALVLGVIWAVWHVPFFVFMMPDPIVCGAAIVTLVSTRVLITWAYNNAGKSVFAAILFHATGNAFLVTVPNTSKAGAIGPAFSCGVVLLAAVIVTFVWGPQTLARYRFAR